MKKIIVVLFLVGLAFAEWQQSEVITLPKGIQINDLAINNAGEIWVLTGSSISKIEPDSKNLLLFQEVKDGKLIAVINDSYYLVHSNNRLTVTNPENNQDVDYLLSAPNQMAIMAVGEKNYVIVSEDNRLLFFNEGGAVASLTTEVEKFSVIPYADYADLQTPFFTLSKNRIYAWSGGNWNKTEDYRSRILYSSSGNILDFAAAPNGKLYVLLADSIVVLEDNGNYEGRVRIENVPVGSRIYAHPSNSNIILFNRQEKTLKFFTGAKKEKGELITLDKNRPNPVDNYTEIEFTIKESLNLTLTIYNLIGEPVKLVANGYYVKGTHLVTWNADDERGKLVPNGIYFYRLETKKGIAIKQLIVLR